MDKQLIVVADPMCSWCWGFSPVLGKIRAAARGRADMRVVMGGLRPGTEAAMDDEMRSYVRHHWEQVTATTGQPFDFGLFERDDFVYNTEPACRAVVVARTLKPGSELDLFETLQRAFYAENTDITAPTVLRDLAVAHGIDADAFTALFNDPATVQATFDDFQEARRLGVRGFPTVVAFEAAANDGAGGYAILTAGYQPYENLGPLLEEWLAA